MPLDGTQNMSFGENNVGELTVDGNKDKGHDPEGHDPHDPAVITMLTAHCDDSRAVPLDPRLPTLVRFSDAVTACPPENTTATLDATSSTTTANADGTGAASPSHRNSQSSQSGANVVSGDSNSNNSNGNNGGQGGASSGNDPQGPDPDMDPTEMIVFTHLVSGGPMAQWAIEGRLAAADMVRLSGPASPQGQTVEGFWQLVRADLVDRVAIQLHFLRPDALLVCTQ